MEAAVVGKGKVMIATISVFGTNNEGKGELRSFYAPPPDKRP